MKLVEWEALGSWSGNDYRSLISNLGGDEVAQAVKSGQLAFKVTKPATDTEAGEFVLETPVKPLFDSHGRVIPPQGLKAKVVNANRAFHLVQPKLDYAERLERLESAFLSKSGVTASEFEGRSADVMMRLVSDPLTANLLIGGICLPIVIPLTIFSKQQDYGWKLEHVFLAAAERSYKSQFAERKFTNHRAGDLTGKVKVVHKSHQVLVDAICSGPVIGFYFPNPLQGFSIPADREIMAHLPQDFLLAGAIDAVTAMIGYPDVLARDYQTPGLDCAAVQWESQAYSLYLEAYDDGLGFDDSYLDAYDDFSGGLLILG